jgi:hypothetical protein
MKKDKFGIGDRMNDFVIEVVKAPDKKKEGKDQKEKKS